jgi:hypothetical protein
MICLEQLQLVMETFPKRLLPQSPKIRMAQQIIAMMILRTSSKIDKWQRR